MKKSFYEGEPRHYVTVDCVVLGFKDDNLYLLLADRRFDPLKGKNSLLAGFVKEDESIDDTVARVVKEYTGIEDIYMEQIGAYGDKNRDIGDRVISIAYYALIDIQFFNNELCNIHKIKWVEISEIDDLILDHDRMIADAIKQLRLKAATEPIGLSLLPEKFTLPQLLNLYEAIYQKEIDKRNFRRRFLNTGVLKKQKDKDMSNSKKGAFYYKFDKDKYTEFVEQGYFMMQVIL